MSEMNLRGKLSIAEIGDIAITDRRSLELAEEMLRYARCKLKVKYYCDKCKKRELDEFFLIEHRKEKYVSEDWKLADKMIILCPDCYDAL
jgi:hypothetical protein